MIPSVPIPVIMLSPPVPAAVIIKDENIWPLVRIHRGGFLLIEFLFLLGINTYGWRHAGVNHVLIFEINPRNNLSHQHLFEVRPRALRSLKNTERWTAPVQRGAVHLSEEHREVDCSCSAGSRSVTS